MISDQCDYCHRDFGREAGMLAICLNCGLENIRMNVDTKRPAMIVRETAMRLPVMERAVMAVPLPAGRGIIPPKRKRRR